MSQINKLYRNFIILQEDERGHSSTSDKTLSGYSKIESKGERCKVSFYAQNLRKDNDDYNIMLICNKKDSKQLIDLGRMVITDSGKGECTKEYFIDNIAGLDIAFDKIIGAAIVKMRDGLPIFIMCGFMNGNEPSDDWKNYKVVKAASEENKSKVEISKKFDKKMDRDGEKDKGKGKDKGKNKNQDKSHNKSHEYDNIENNDKDHKNDKDHECDNKENNDKKHECNECNKGNSDKEHECNECNKGNSDKKHECNECNKGNSDKKHESDNNGRNEKNKNDDQDKKYEECIQVEKVDPRGKFDEYEESIEVSAKGKEDLLDTFEVRGSVGEYFEGIARGFTNTKDKYKEIKYCKWYEVRVNDLYEMCNTSNYNKYTVAYFPMLNYYPYIKKHGKFMLGYKCDKERNLKYIVYGIPGRKDKDEQPYEGKTGFVTWISDDDNNRDGMGCWLMFYDFKNSTVVVPMQ